MPRASRLWSHGAGSASGAAAAAGDPHGLAPVKVRDANDIGCWCLAAHQTNILASWRCIGPMVLATRSGHFGLGFVHGKRNGF